MGEDRPKRDEQHPELERRGKARRAVLGALTAAVTVLLVSATAYAAAGSLDPSFGGAGVATTAILGSGGGQVRGTAVQADGKVVVVGEEFNGGSDMTCPTPFTTFYCGNSNYDWALARFGADGALDPGFGSGGKLDVVWFGGNGELNLDGGSATAVTVDGSGRIVAAGYLGSNLGGQALVGRFAPDGSSVEMFPLVSGGCSGAEFNAVALQPDGSIVAAGVGGPDCQIMVVRYLSDGSLDSSFGSGGVVYTDLSPDFGSGATSLVVQPNGRLLVGGWAGVDAGGDALVVARYLSNGALDPSFGSGGVVEQSTPPSGSIEALALQSKGRIVAGGYYIGSPFSAFLTRYTSSGALDSTFGSGGVVHDTSHLAIYSVAVDTTDRIIAGGDSGGSGDAPPGAFVSRYSKNGALDSAFGTSGSTVFNYAASGPSTLRGLVLQPDGRVVAAGTQQDVSNGSSLFGAARLRGDVDHFTVSVAGPVTAGSPFTVTITAKDASGKTVKSFVGSVNWSDTSGDLTPAAPASFVGGVSTTQGVISSPFKADVITVNGGGTSGNSAKFNVLGPLAQLSISGVPSNIPAGATFTVTVTAKDALGDKITDYNAPATWSDRSGFLAPATPSDFSSGVSKTTASVTQPYTNDKITITTGGVSATSKAFTVN